jgi:hypothetical protein
MIRIPGARLIPINFNPYSGSTACALVLRDPATVQEMSRFTGGSADNSPHSAEFTRLADVAEAAFENSAYRNKDHKTETGAPILLEPYQKIGIAFALARKGRAGLFDPMGLGKTVQAIGLALACPERYLPLVVVCPRNAIGAWKKQLGGTNEPSKSWVQPGALRVKVIQSQSELLAAAGSISREPSRDYAYIIWNEMLAAPKGDADADQRDVAVQAIAKALESQGLLVFDEAHYFRVPTSELFRRGYAMARTAAHVLALTGTPSMSAITETLPILALVDPDSAVIPALKDFRGVVANGPQTSASRKAAEAAAKAEADQAGKAVAPTPWNKLQTRFIEHYAGKGNVSSVPENTKLRDFAPEYSDEYAKAVENDFRQLVVRRSRQAVMTKTLSPPLKIGVGQKDRRLVLEPVPEAIKLGAESDNPFRYFQRAGLMALLDGQILDYVARKYINGQQNEDRRLQVLMGNDHVLGILRDFRCATSKLRSGVGSLSALRMGQVVAPSAARRFGKGHRPTVYFMDNLKTAYDLAGRLWNLYGSLPKFELYLYTGSKAGRVVGSIVETKGDSDASSLYDVELGSYLKAEGDSQDGKTDLEKIASRFEPQHLNEPRILVAAQAGREGVDLPAGAEVIFIQRFEAPGMEEQAEDRINRANRLPGAPKPQILYYMPEHYNAFVILNRLERRRSAALKTYGETPQSDYSTPLVFPYQDDTVDAKMDYLRRSFAAESGVTTDFREYLLNRIEWALSKKATTDQLTIRKQADRLSDPGKVYHTMMKLPQKFAFEDWCAEPKTPRAAPKKGGTPGPRQDRTGEAIAQEGKTVTTPDIPVGQTAQTTAQPTAQRTIRRAGGSAPAAARPTVRVADRDGTWKPVQGENWAQPGRYIHFVLSGRPIEVYGRLVKPPTGALAGARYYQKTDAAGIEEGPRQSQLVPDRLFKLESFTPSSFSNPYWLF